MSWTKGSVHAYYGSSFKKSMCTKADGHMRRLTIETESKLGTLWDQQECKQKSSNISAPRWSCGKQCMNRLLGAAALPPLRFSAPQGAHPAHLDQKKLRRPLAEKLETEENQLFTEDNQLFTGSTDRLLCARGRRVACHTSQVEAHDSAIAAAQGAVTRLCAVTSSHLAVNVWSLPDCLVACCDG
jgi:hypothetical protein